MRLTDPGATYERLIAKLAEVEENIAHYEAQGWPALVEIAKRRRRALRGRLTWVRRNYLGEE